jgi:hypothetical protein
MGVCAPLLDLQPPATLTDAVKERDRLDETLIRKLATPHRCGLDLLAVPANAVEAARVDDEVMARILTRARRACGYVARPRLDAGVPADDVLHRRCDLAQRPRADGALPVLDGRPRPDGGGGAMVLQAAGVVWTSALSRVKF